MSEPVFPLHDLLPREDDGYIVLTVEEGAYYVSMDIVEVPSSTVQRLTLSEQEWRVLARSIDALLSKASVNGIPRK